ncbi:MAG: carbamate kinase [Candidatus Hodarchaeota archaeon]
MILDVCQLEKIVVALGGNMIHRVTQRGTIGEQLENAEKISFELANIVRKGYELLITHGNGPQVGNILHQNERSKEIIPAMPLDVCGAESQGMIGYILQNSLHNAFRKSGIEKVPMNIITRVVVDETDQAFRNPTKPVGPYYTAEEMDKVKREGWDLVEDPIKGYRRIVPSPYPKKIIEGAIIRRLVDLGLIVIAGGGGGIPVVEEEDGTLRGVEAVVDKDFVAEKLGVEIGAEVILFVMDIEKVAINFGKPNQQNLDKLSLTEAENYMDEGHFPPGSMGPKIRSAIGFLKAGGKKVVISSLETIEAALLGKAGTTLYRN